MDKTTFCKCVALWTAMIAAVIMLIIGFAFGKQIETTLFGEIYKWDAGRSASYTWAEMLSACVDQKLWTN